MTLDNLGVLLRAREQELTAIYENVPGIVFYIAVEPVGEFRFLSVSRDFLAVTGLSREQVVGSLVRNVIPPPSCEMVLNHYRAALRSGQTVRWKEESVYPAGQRYGEVAVTPLYDASGRATHLIGIVHDITERERELSKVNERLRLALEAGSTGGWDFDVKTGETVLFGMAHAQLGMSPDDTSGTREDFWDQVHEDDVERYRSAIASAREKKEPFKVEFRVVQRNGTIRWLRTQGRYYYTPDGAPERLLGISLDVTDLKRAEELLADMTRKLIESQELERKRISRELHDDINQRLAMLSVEFERLQQSPSDLLGHVQELRKELRQISDDVQGISHDLHSSRLEYLGAVRAMKSWCKEVSERHKIGAEFRSDFSGHLPLNVGLPLFRVLQEAVNNAVKHSGEKQIEVQLFEESGEIHLIVRDSGKGFDVDKALRGEGLGLTSMRERVRLVNGTIDIQSAPTRGTNIHVRVPLEARSNAERLPA